MPVIEKTREETFAMETTIARTPSKAYLMAKRLFDIIASSAALILLSPVFLILAFLVKRDDGGPATYVCSRVGKKGKTIRIRKFRSMVLDADNLEKYLTQDQIEQYKREFKLDDDPRMTKIGKILRKTSLDELESDGVRVLSGYQPNIEVYYQAADVYFFPTISGNYVISIPLSVMEALACGIAVVGYKHFPGMQEIESTDPNAMLLIGDSDNIAWALKQQAQHTMNANLLQKKCSWGSVAEIVSNELEKKS